jgi:hypothetical protein
MTIMSSSKREITLLTMKYILDSTTGRIQWNKYYTSDTDIEELHKHNNFKKLVKKLRESEGLTEEQVRLVNVVTNQVKVIKFSNTGIELLKKTLKLSHLNRIKSVNWREIVKNNEELEEIYLNSNELFRNKVRTLSRDQLSTLTQCKRCGVKFTRECLMKYGIRCACNEFLEEELKDLEFTFFVLKRTSNPVKTLTNTVIYTGKNMEILPKYKTNKFDILVDVSGKMHKILEEKRVTLKDIPRISDPYFPGVGILFSKPIEFKDSLKCFKREVSFCKCTIRCVLRNISNTFYKNPKKDRWYPLKTQEIDQYRFEEVKPPTKDNKDTKDKCDGTFENVINNCKNIQESTRITYIQVLSSLYNKGLFYYITVPHLFISEMEKQYNKSSTIKNLSVILVFLGKISNECMKKLFAPQNFTLMHIVQGIYKDCLEEYRKNHDTSTKSLRQETNWVTWKELEDLVEIIKHKDFTEYITLKLHIHQNTLRNDYGTLKYRNFNEESDNYINLSKGVIVWNKYKTSKHHGCISYNIAELLKEDLEKLVKIRIKENKSDYLFGRYLTNEQYGGILRGVTKRYLNKSIGSQMMRTIKVTEFRKNEISMEEENEFARNMQHTSNTSRTHYRKN